MAGSWLDFWNADTPIYVSERHKLLHYRLIAGDVAALVPSPDAVVLDHGCGEALSAGTVAGRCARLYLCDGAPSVRDRLNRRFGGEPRIAVLAPEDVDALPDGTITLIVANSLAQYLAEEELRALLATWRRKLAPDGTLVLADIIPRNLSPLTDASALLSFAWKGGFMTAALAGLVRTAFSDYRKLRGELGLSQYDDTAMLALLREAGFQAERRAANLGHNNARMTFMARRTSGAQAAA